MTFKNKLKELQTLEADLTYELYQWGLLKYLGLKSNDKKTNSKGEPYNIRWDLEINWFDELYGAQKNGLLAVNYDEPSGCGCCPDDNIMIQIPLTYLDMSVEDAIKDRGAKLEAKRLAKLEKDRLEEEKRIAKEKEVKERKDKAEYERLKNKYEDSND